MLLKCMEPTADTVHMAAVVDIWLNPGYVGLAQSCSVLCIAVLRGTMVGKMWACHLG